MMESLRKRALKNKRTKPTTLVLMRMRMRERKQQWDDDDDEGKREIGRFLDGGTTASEVC